MKIEDNFLDQEKFDELQTIMMGKEFPWYMVGNIDYEEQKNKFQFVHMFYHDYAPQSVFCEKLEPIFNKIMDMDIHPRVKRMWKLHWETGMRLRESFIGSINGEWYDIPPDGAKTHTERNIQLNQEQIETIQMIQEHWQDKPTIDRIKWYSKQFKKALKAAGINDRYFHGLRHSFGVHLWP